MLQSPFLSCTRCPARWHARCVTAAISHPLKTPAFCLLAFSLIFFLGLAYHLQLSSWYHPWTVWVAFLLSLPLTSAIHLSLLLSALWIYRKHSAARERGSASYVLLVNREDSDSDPESEYFATLTRQTGPHHGSFGRFFWCQCLLYLTVILLALTTYRHYESGGDVRYRPALRAALADPQRRPAGYARGEKVFIAANFHNNEDVIPYWTRTIHDVTVWLGRENVFVSVVESYSKDASPRLLREFARELDERGVPNRVLVGDERIPKAVEDIAFDARIAFLAGVRNEVLEPLLERGGYDRVLFTNDVFVEPESVIELLETNGGAFDFACGLDFGNFGLYDMWVMRDRLGRLASSMWPYVMDRVGIRAVRADAPFPVFTCWNGIVAFDAEPLLPVHLRANRTLSAAPRTRAQMPPVGHPAMEEGVGGVLGSSPALTRPLAFRSRGQSEACFSSECFLLPYDFRRVMGLERIFANPRVITAYRWKYYVWFKWVLRQSYVRWFVERVWNGAGMHDAMMIVPQDDDSAPVSSWDGGDCHPWRPPQ